MDTLRIDTLRLVLIMAALSLFVAASNTHAGALDDAMEAYNAGKFTVAVQLLRPLAESGDADAQSMLGGLYESGQGVPKDSVVAVSWFRKAADQGQGNAQYNLGLAYAEGRGVAKSDAEALVWLRKSAEQGIPQAQNALGVLFDYGRGVPQDKTQAAIWYQKAATQGHPRARYNLGLLYKLGQGVPLDKDRAYELFRLAADGGFTDAKRELASVTAPIATSNDGGQWKFERISVQGNPRTSAITGNVINPKGAVLRFAANCDAFTGGDQGRPLETPRPGTILFSAVEALCAEYFYSALPGLPFGAALNGRSCPDQLELTSVAEGTINTVVRAKHLQRVYRDPACAEYWDALADDVLVDRMFGGVLITLNLDGPSIGTGGKCSAARHVDINEQLAREAVRLAPANPKSWTSLFSVFEAHGCPALGRDAQSYAGNPMGYRDAMNESLRAGRDRNPEFMLATGLRLGLRVASFDATDEEEFSQEGTRRLKVYVAAREGSSDPKELTKVGWVARSIANDKRASRSDTSTYLDKASAAYMRAFQRTKDPLTKSALHVAAAEAMFSLGKVDVAARIYREELPFIIASDKLISRGDGQKIPEKEQRLFSEALSNVDHNASSIYTVIKVFVATKRPAEATKLFEQSPDRNDPQKQEYVQRLLRGENA